MLVCDIFLSKNEQPKIEDNYKKLCSTMRNAQMFFMRYIHLAVFGGCS